ncbi:MAG: right-handed parallel beta-helix repeat-containing protein [Sphingobium sp.]
MVSESGRRSKIDLTVSSIDELHSALARAGDGSTIKLLAGVYPAATISGVEKDGNVTITSADPAHHAVVQGLTVRGSSGLTISQIDLPATAPGAQYGMLLVNSHNINLDQLVFTSPAVPVDIKVISALELRNVKNVVVSRSQFRNFWHGIGILNVENTKIVANEFRDMRTDGIRGGGVNNILIAQNICTDFYPIVPDHPDCIQLWSTNQLEPGRNIRIVDNLAWRRNGIRTQGIFIRDTFNKLPFENVEISGNLLIGTMYHGIAISGVRGASITNNEVIAYPDQKAWILVANGSDVLEKDNRAQAFTFKNSPDVKQSNNRLTSPTDKHISKRIAAWLAMRPDMQKNAGPLLRELSSGD